MYFKVFSGLFLQKNLQIHLRGFLGHSKVVAKKMKMQFSIPISSQCSLLIPQWKHQKTNISYPLIRTRTWRYQGARNVFFYVFKGNQTETLERNGLNSKYFMKLVKHVLTHNRLMFGTLTLKWEWNIHLDCVNHLVAGVH